MRTILAPFLLLLLAAVKPAEAEVEKLATVCEKGICPHWWPKLVPPTGWIHDRDQSYSYNINALAPYKESFVEAETVMYANAVYKPRVPESRTVSEFIQGDLETFKERTPGLTIREARLLKTRDGKVAQTWLMEPKSAGQWERIAYFEEGDYYMVFVISSRTSGGLLKHMQAYEALVTTYAE